MISRKRILVVDDDRALAQAVATRCGFIGLDTECCFSGLDVLNRVDRDPPDMIVMDINLPGTDGLAVCEMLNAETSRPPIPVVLLTGRSDSKTVAQCEKVGASYVLKGPCLWERLGPIVKEALGLESESSADGLSEETPDEVTRELSDEPRKPRVLVIDDDPAISKVLDIRLSAYGIEVLRATNGTQGYWMAIQNEPDVIITDYTMPDGEGDYVLTRLRGHPLSRHIPVVVLTGRTYGGQVDHSLKRELLGLGAQAFLIKPINFEQLLSELTRWIDIVPELAVKPGTAPA